MAGYRTKARAVTLMQEMMAVSSACPCHGGGAGVHIHHSRPGSVRSFADSDTTTDYAFEMAASNIRYGPGVTAEVGMDAGVLGKRVLVLTDNNLVDLPPYLETAASLRREQVEFEVFADVEIEPTDSSMKAAIDFATKFNPDVIIAVGGGSVIDTAKVANLYSTYPDADFLDFVNAPVGKGLPVPGPVKPLIAVPTTAGTGSETTGVAIFDYKPLGAKTGIGSRILKPLLGVVDPHNMMTMPAEVRVASGFDVLCHALESFTAVPYQQRSPRPSHPTLRPAYQGSNPISDIWVRHSLGMMAKDFVESVENPTNFDATETMALASTYAGVGFGNAGVHLPHGMSYPVSGLNKGYHHPGYKTDKALVPHGVSVILNAPAVFRFTGPTNPERHLEAAAMLGVDVSNAKADDSAGEYVAEGIIRLMQRLNVPNGLSALGFGTEDLDALVQGTLPQKRVTGLAPAPVGADELHHIFEDSLVAW